MKSENLYLKDVEQTNTSFDVNEWAAPEFLERAARELLEEEWKKRTTSKLPHSAGTLESGGRVG